jgi:hypothetical protein
MKNKSIELTTRYYRTSAKNDKDIEEQKKQFVDYLQKIDIEKYKFCPTCETCNQPMSEQGGCKISHVMIDGEKHKRIKSGNESYKHRKTLFNDPSEYLVFENKHEAIIDEVTFERVQKLVLDRKPGTNRFSNRVITNGLLLRTDGFYCEYIDPVTGEVVTVINEIVVYDSRDARFEQPVLVNYFEIEVIEEGNEYILTQVIDEVFLSAEDTVYPVVIDPETVIFNPTTNIVRNATVYDSTQQDASSHTRPQYGEGVVYWEYDMTHDVYRWAPDGSGNTIITPWYKQGDDLPELHSLFIDKHREFVSVFGQDVTSKDYVADLANWILMNSHYELILILGVIKHDPDENLWAWGYCDDNTHDFWNTPPIWVVIDGESGELIRTWDKYGVYRRQ